MENRSKLSFVARQAILASALMGFGCGGAVKGTQSDSDHVSGAGGSGNASGGGSARGGNDNPGDPGEKQLPGSAGGAIGDGGSGAGVCCPPDPHPGCCMHYGGWSDSSDHCSETCDGMPNPGDPSWHLAADDHGCKVWRSGPNFQGNFCGAAPLFDGSDASEAAPQEGGCQFPATFGYAVPGCVDPVFACVAGVDDAPLTAHCDCFGQTFGSVPQYADRPFASLGACPDGGRPGLCDIPPGAPRVFATAEDLKVAVALKWVYCGGQPDDFNGASIELDADGTWHLLELVPTSTGNPGDTHWAPSMPAVDGGTPTSGTFTIALPADDGGVATITFSFDNGGSSTLTSNISLSDEQLIIGPSNYVPVP